MKAKTSQHSNAFSLFQYQTRRKTAKKMAATFHIRSNSFPSRQHPQAAHVEEQLCRLRSSEATSTSSSSSIGQRLTDLQDLHDSLEKLLRLPFTQQTLDKKAVEKLLDGSLRILDLCNMTKDALSQTKECLNEIQSILRRKRGDLSSEVKKYLASRRSLKKSFQKVLKSLEATNGDESLTVFGEAEGLTISLFDSLFSFVSESTTPSGKWSLVSKLMNHKRVACEAQTANEFAKVDSAFQSFTENKSENTLKMEDVKRLESCVQDLEEGIESLFKSLMKYRVSLLNTFGH
ncbi:PREDICTED: uncharacterized protein LOC104819669 [Tarenaya hassleriana]|uniref:uncharacterized protein LOC104819669 n=1 Tax=Tarenaya hassleriana TaxID=28532 RepID=UPI00053CA166|nr:PREDICTED: uncharacterized protein LOC104819669 [Tarenaya hassleriana]